MVVVLFIEASRLDRRRWVVRVLSGKAPEPFKPDTNCCVCVSCYLLWLQTKYFTLCLHQLRTSQSTVGRTGKSGPATGAESHATGSLPQDILSLGAGSLKQSATCFGVVFNGFGNDRGRKSMVFHLTEGLNLLFPQLFFLVTSSHFFPL